MIIRSQDKRSITNFSQLTDISIHPIGTNNCYYSVVACYPFAIGDDYSNMSLGKYSTIEKAIKVLDMIQEKFQEPIYQNDIGGNEIAIYKSKVFQMPKDEEVKE